MGVNRKTGGYRVGRCAGCEELECSGSGGAIATCTRHSIVQSVNGR